uniref:NS3-like protein n=1 Tax=Mesocestoides corti TaxID=53468 RepID=A0A5K3G8C9_MESCO
VVQYVCALVRRHTTPHLNTTAARVGQTKVYLHKLEMDKPVYQFKKQG